MIAYCEPKLTWETWQAKYRPLIRVCVDWGMLQKPKPKVGRLMYHSDLNLLVNPTIYFPWFGKKNWRNGSPDKVILGETDCVVVAPAVVFDDWDLMLLDSCHRVAQHKPKILILDYIEPLPNQLCAFNDLLGEWRYR